MVCRCLITRFSTWSVSRWRRYRSSCASNPPRPFVVELWIGGLDAQKEAISAGELEALDVENRMIGHRQAIERNHAENRRQRGHENGQFKGDRNKDRPAVQRPAADVDRVIDGGNPILQIESAERSRECRRSEQAKAGGFCENRSLREAVDGKRAIAVHLAISFGEQRRAASSNASGSTNSAMRP